MMQDILDVIYELRLIGYDDAADYICDFYEIVEA